MQLPGEARAANAEVRDESKDNGCPTELRQARNFDCDVSLIETEHDEIGVKGCQDRSSDKCHVVHKPRDGIAQRVAHHAAGGAKDNKLDGHDDDHGEQRLQEQFGNVGNNLLKAAVDKVHEYNAQYDGHYRTRIVVRRDGNTKKVETLGTANGRADHDAPSNAPMMGCIFMTAAS